MSRENVELAQEVVGAVAERDVSRLLELADPEVEWRPFSAQLREKGVYHGHEGLRQYLNDLEDAFEAMWAEVDTHVAVGAMIFLVGRLRYRGRGSGLETESAAGWLIKVRDGRVVHMRAVREPEQMLEAMLKE